MSRKQLAHDVWLVGGGTGGHVVPLLAVAEELTKHEHIRLTFLGDKRGVEAGMVHKALYKFMHVPTGKLRRDIGVSSLINNVFDSMRIVAGIVKTYYLIGKHRPAVILSKGGPVALPVAIAGWLRGVTIITHESDIVIGAANAWIARLANVVLTGFPVTSYPAGLAQKIKHVGIPLRSDFSKKVHVHQHHRPMVLVTGGSQGAASVGSILIACLPDILKHADVMHICGASSVKECEGAKSALPESLRDSYAYVPYTDTFADYVRESTLVVTRGGSQIFEIATLEKPMLIIPLPWSAQNHQLKNAEYFARHDAAIVLRQEGLTPEKLYETIRALLEDRPLRQSLARHAHQFESSRAAHLVAQCVLDQLNAQS